MSDTNDDVSRGMLERIRMSYDLADEPTMAETYDLALLGFDVREAFLEGGVDLLAAVGKHFVDGFWPPRDVRSETVLKALRARSEAE